MELPRPVYYPPFNITRASHVVMTVRNLAASRDFYVNVIGLVVSSEDTGAVYLRGLEEACHHSLVLKKSSGDPVCERIGMRVLTDDELDKAKNYFDQRALPAAWVEVPHQGRTLHVSDDTGMPLEFCATMQTERRLYTDFELFKGGSAQRFDHFQILVPDARASCEFYAAMGFRVAEYMTTGDELTAAFMFRKGATQDIVFFTAPGPRIHHFAYTVSESRDIFRACDIAGNLGFGQVVERGPGRHGPAGVLFVYFRDPDGHRVELFNNHYQTIDIEVAPVHWDTRDQSLALRWGLPAQRKWFVEATSFPGVALQHPARKGEPATLEKFLLEQQGAS